jgi:LAS superfamily LD-carboxypeptidase LdcB
MGGGALAGGALAGSALGAKMGLIGGLPGMAIGAGIGAIAGGAAYYLPKMAVGGITNGPSLAGEAGTEAVVPLPNGRSIPVSFTGDQNSIGAGGTDLVTSNKFSQVRNELLKDNIALAKLTDRQLIDQRRYDSVLSAFHRMSIRQMEDQMGEMSQEDLQNFADSVTKGLASATGGPAAGGSATGSESSTGVRMSRIVDAAGKLLETRVGGHRNWRNNNPGNIMYGDFAVSMGAIGTDGRFAIFPDMEMGYKAADALMKSKNYQNLTIGDAIKRWAPPSENNTGAYQRTFQKAGFDTGSKYSDLSPAMQRKYLETKMRMEGGQAGQVVAGSSPASSSAESSAKNLNDLFDFGSASGSKSNFEQMESGFKSAVIKAAEEYNATTGKKMRINSAKRDSADQERLYSAYLARGKTGMPVAEPGKSRHERGMAVDIQNYNDSKAVAALNNQGLYQKVPNDPVHFQFAKGGIGRGPRSGYLATLHGPEAVVPLPDGKTIPVRIQGLEDGKMFDTLKSDMGNMLSQVRDVLNVVSQKMDNATMVSLMDEMVRVQKSSVDIQQKMLRANT